MLKQALKPETIAMAMHGRSIYSNKTLRHSNRAVILYLVYSLQPAPSQDLTSLLSNIFKQYTNVCSENNFGIIGKAQKNNTPVGEYFGNFLKE